MEEKYPELGNLMPRDITAREVWTVSRDYEVFLDMTELPKEVMEHKLAGLVDDCQTYLHKDIRKEPIPILPGIHYFMGGIQVDERHRTSMRNLYAAGECCAQYHGANRLGGNSLLGAIYGGQIAAETACRETVSSPNMPCAEESLLPELSPDAQMQMNRILLNALGVVRDAQTLEAGIQEIRKLSGTLPLLAVPCWKVPSPEKKAGVRTGGQIIPNATMPFTAKPPWHTGTGSISPSALNPSPKGGMIYELHHPNQTAGKPAGFTLLAGVFL